MRYLIILLMCSVCFGVQPTGRQVVGALTADVNALADGNDADYLFNLAAHLLMKGQYDKSRSLIAVSVEKFNGYAFRSVGYLCMVDVIEAIDKNTPLTAKLEALKANVADMAMVSYLLTVAEKLYAKDRNAEAAALCDYILKADFPASSDDYIAQIRKLTHSLRLAINMPIDVNMATLKGEPNQTAAFAICEKIRIANYTEFIDPNKSDSGKTAEQVNALRADLIKKLDDCFAIEPNGVYAASCYLLKGELYRQRGDYANAVIAYDNYANHPKSLKSEVGQVLAIHCLKKNKANKEEIDDRIDALKADVRFKDSALVERLNK